MAVIILIMNKHCSYVFTIGHFTTTYLFCRFLKKIIINQPLFSDSISLKEGMVSAIVLYRLRHII